MKKRILATAVCLVAHGVTYAQPTGAPISYATPPTTAVDFAWYRGGNLLGGAAGANNIFGFGPGNNSQIWHQTNGFNRLMMMNGLTGNNDGRIAIGNNLPAGFTPFARLHMHQTGGNVFTRYTTVTTGFATANEGFVTGITDPGFAFLTNFEPTQPIAFFTNDGIPTGTFGRMQIHAFNNNGFIGVGNALGFVPAAQLHINTIGANAAVAGALGEVFRTDGLSTLDNNWRMFTGPTMATTTQKGRFFAGPVTGVLHVNNNNIHPLSENFNIEATQADMVFYANGTRNLGTTPITERMRITSEDPGTGIDITRVSISRTAGNEAVEPRSMLHIGDDWNNPGVGGHRAWMDVGTYYNTTNDILYVGQQNVAGDRNDAVIGWGDNAAIFNNNAGIGDRLYFRFLDNLTNGNLSSGANGLEMARMVSDGSNGRMSIGNPAVGPFDPGNTLEIISSANSPQPAGLRFRNLNSASAPVANPGPGVLTVDANGDVIYVIDSTCCDTSNACCIGNFCGTPQNPLTGSWEVPLANNNYVFTGQGTVNNNVGIGTNCSPTAKLEVLQTAGPGLNTAVAATTNATGTFNRGHFLNSINGVQNYGIHMNVNGSTSTTNTLVNSSVGLLCNMNANLNRVYGIFENINALNDAWGERILVNGTTNPVNVTGIDVNVTTITTSTSSNTSMGGRFFANGANFNYGVFASILPSGTGANPSAFSSPSGPDFAGYFDGDVVITGDLGVLSDSRLKKDISKIENSLDIINRLNPVTYNFDRDNHKNIALSAKKQYGFIAQEVEKVLPELTMDIRQPAIYDTSGREIFAAEKFTGVNYNGFIAILTDAIKLQQQQLDTQNKEIEALKELLSGGNAPTTNGNSQDVTLTDKNSVVLDQNVPNPFAEQTTITYALPTGVQKAQMLFYNADGRLINSVDLDNKQGKGQL
ncbi:MAG TPA: tail fiber domain-containing protein, partial [Flavobacteriales bacterium]|nr:tail fiber domain-containing protein [Flavobacteriales bacterium]